MDQAYRAADEDRALIDRSLDLMSKELTEHNTRLRAELAEKARTEAALRESEERFQYASRAANDVLYDRDIPAGRWWWSDALTVRYAHPRGPEQARVGWWESQVHPEDLPGVKASQERAMAGGREVWSAEYRFRRGDDSWAYVVDRAFIVQDPSGKPVRLIGSMLELTERRIAEEALRQSEQRFAIAVNATQEVVWDWDVVRDTIWANRNLEARFGWPPERLRRVADWLERVHPQDLERVRRDHQRAMDGAAELYNSEYRFRRADGTWADVLDRGVVLRRDADGRALRMIGSMLDVSARKEAERELRESEARLAEAQALAHLGHWEVDLATGRSRWSAEQFRLLGLDPAPEPTPEMFLPRVHPEDRPRMAGEALAAALARDPGGLDQLADRVPEGGAEHTFRIVLPDGAVRHIHGTVKLVREDGRPARLIGTHQDVTERRAAEAALRESEQRFRELAEQVHDTFWIVTPDLAQLLYVSPAYEELTGRPMRHLQEHWATFLEDHVHPEDRAMFEGVMRGLAAAGRAEFEHRVLHADGSVRWAHQRVSLVRGPGGEPARIIAAATDITQRKAAEAALHREERMATLGSLAAGVAHEINNPLGFIKANEQLNQVQIAALRAHPGLPPELAGQLGAVEDTFALSLQGLDRIEGIVAGLRLLTRPSAARERVDLAAVALSTLQLAAAKAKHVEVATDLPPGAVVMGNARELAQVVLNLVINAIEAAPSPGGRVELALAAAGPWVELRVRDNGPGIAPAVLPRLFQPFVTNKPGGTGLGLAISQRIATDHGGVLEARSVPGAGATFLLRLPAAPPAHPAPPGASPAAPPRAASVPTS